MRVKPRLDTDWKNKMIEKMEKLKNKEPGAEDIEFRTTSKIAKQWLVLRLSERGIPYRFENLGAGVSLITTDVDRCPMCKSPLYPKKEK